MNNVKCIANIIVLNLLKTLLLGVGRALVLQIDSRTVDAAVLLFRKSKVKLYCLIFRSSNVQCQNSRRTKSVAELGLLFTRSLKPHILFRSRSST